MIYKPRTAWQKPTQPVTGPKAVPVGNLVDVVYHYPGASASSAPLWNYPVARLQSMQADYLANRGYSLGYNWGIDLEGVVWEIRGFDIKSAATGGYNDKSVTILFMLPGTQGANKAQLYAATELHREIERRANKRLGVAGHFQRGTTATPCPGAGVIVQLPSLDRMIHAAPEPEPTPNPDPFVGEDEDMFYVFKNSDGGYYYGRPYGWHRWCGGTTGAAITKNGAIDLKTGNVVNSFADVQKVSDTVIITYMGPAIPPTL